MYDFWKVFSKYGNLLDVFVNLHVDIECVKLFEDNVKELI